jgi:hypothetical protein
MKSGISKVASGRKPTFLLKRQSKLSVFLRTVMVTIFAVAGMTGVAGTGVAHAQGGQSFCGYDGSGVYCLDDWADGDYNSQVALYVPAANEEFAEVVLTGRCGGYVEDIESNGANCPFGNSVFDERYAGWAIVQLQYQGGYDNGYCLATGNGSGDDGNRGVIGSCNTGPKDIGGSPGTIFVDHNGYMINLYWSNQAQYGNNAACMQDVLNNGQDGAGSYVNLDLDTVDGCTLWDSQIYS